LESISIVFKVLYQYLNASDGILLTDLNTF